MLNKRERKAWNDFRSIILDIEQDDALLSIFTKISEFYLANKRYFPLDLINLYKIDELVNIDPEDYPILRSESTPSCFKNLLSINPSKAETVLMFIRDSLWEIIVLNVDIQCPHCSQEIGLSALFDVETEIVVLECIQCGHIQTTDNQPYETPNILHVAKTKDLIAAGLLPSHS
jgi:Zn ribbon nucleic-acid-binding protein